MKAITKITEPESDEIRVCFVSDKCDVNLRQSVHKKVCFKLKLTKHIDGQFYCLLHLPTEEKNVIQFKKTFQSRIKEIDKKISNIESEFPNNEVKQTEEFDKFDFDFRYVYFPLEVDFVNRKFQVDVDFSHAVFKCKVDFTKTTFLAKTFFISTLFSTTTDFSEATFTGDAHFSKTTFNKEGFFDSTTFSSNSDFSEATFLADTHFSKTIFKADTNFYSATFSAEVDFKSAIFSAEANFYRGTYELFTDFSSTTFLGKANFELGTFNSKVDFKSAAFLAYTVFSSATFSAEVDFSDAIFSKFTDFSSTVFLAKANFYFGTFLADVDFKSATFSADTFFILVIFSADANFNTATFKSQTSFRSATFAGEVDFSWAKLNETSQTYFYETRFCRNIRFGNAEIEGFVEFEGNVFLDSNNVQEVKRQLEDDFSKLNEKLDERGIEYNISTNYITDGQVAVFEFGDTRLRNPERISFYSIRLRPSWFVNVDEARKLAFNDVEWINTEIDTDRQGLDDEIQSLKTRNIKREEVSLGNAYNQLADNAEANRRFEEAKQFKKLVIALQGRKCHIHDAVQSHKKDDIRKGVCSSYPVVNEDGGNYYCLWHNPDKNKAEVFLKEFNKRQNEVHSRGVDSETNEIVESSDFRSVFFPITVEYKGELPSSLTFTGATFQRRVVFDGALIHNLDFNEAYFEEAAELVFENSECDGKINLYEAVFAGKFFLRGNQNYVFFKTSNKKLSLKNAKFARPDWVNFRSLILRPHYFLEADPSKFNFHDCKWSENKNKTLVLADELKVYQKKELAKVYNQIAVNYEENRQFEESSDFRYAAMETKRLDYTGLRKVVNLYWFYKWTSGYGEHWRWATGILLSLLILFSVLYAMPFAKFDYGDKGNPQTEGIVHRFCEDNARIITNYSGMNLCDGAVHSLSVASFQRPEPKPADTLTRFFVTLETILAPIQAALLALAIRRKFIR